MGGEIILEAAGHRYRKGVLLVAVDIISTDHRVRERYGTSSGRCRRVRVAAELDLARVQAPVEVEQTGTFGHQDEKSPLPRAAPPAGRRSPQEPPIQRRVVGEG